MIADIWNSYRRLPVWVQVWVVAILVPVNVASLGFWSAPGWGLVAVLAIGAMALNLPILLAERGLSKAMAWPHLALWIPLVLLLIMQLVGDGPAGGHRQYLMLLLAVDLVSLGFDLPDAWKWLKGDRAVA